MGSELRGNSTSGLSPSFLMIGVTAACLRVCGTETKLREDLIISMMSGEMAEMAERQFMMSLDGT